MKRVSALVALPFASMLFAACSSSDPASPSRGNGSDAAADTSTGTDSPDANVAVRDSGASSDTSLPPDASSTTADETWADGKTIAQSTVIEAGVTVTIAPGAKIAIAANATVVVKGTLTASSVATHATLGDGNAAWGGIVVAQGGTLALDGVDLKKGGIHVQAGDASAKWDHGAFDGGSASLGIAPFTVDKGGTFSTAHASVVNPGARSLIKGTFTASYLDYLKSATYAIYTNDPSAVVSIEDSTFHSNLGNVGDDVLETIGVQKFHVAYTDIGGAHCGFHFESPDNASIDIDHVTVHGVQNGADIWGSSQSGTKTITNSNFLDSNEGLDVQDNANGPTTVTNCYVASKTNPGFPGVDVKQQSPAAAEIADAHPR